jgi:chromosomal replication initiation ATPase DnaA
MRETMEGKVTHSYWLMVGAIDMPRSYGREAAIRKCQRAAYRWGYDWEELVARNRSRDMVECRQIMAKYLRDQGWMLNAIGKFLGGRDHATCLYSVKQAEHLLDYDKPFRAKYYEFMNA